MEEMYYEMIRNQEYPMLFFEYESGRIITMNQAAESFLGRGAEDLYSFFKEGQFPAFEEGKKQYNSGIFYERWIWCGRKEKPIDLEISTFMCGTCLTALMIFDLSLKKMFSGYRKKSIPRFYAKDTQMRVQVVSRGVMEDMGVSQDIRGKINEDVFSGTGCKVLFDAENSVYRNQKIQIGNMELYSIDKKKSCFIEANRMPRKTETGKFEGILCIYNSVLSRAEYKLLLEETQKENEFYAQLLSRDGRFPIKLHWDGENFVVDFVSYWIQEYGYTAEELYDGRVTLEYLFGNDGFKKFEQKFENRERKAEKQEPVLYYLRKADDSRVRILDEAEWKLWDGVWYYEGIFTDLDYVEYHHAGDKEKGSGEKYRSQLLGAPNGFVVRQPEKADGLLLEKGSMAEHLKNAIDKGCVEFVTYYQPIVDSVSGELAGTEALLRWVSPDLGFINPMDFIPLSEYMGLILPLGKHIMEEVFETASRWGKKGIKFHINLSVVQLIQPDIVSQIVMLAEKWRIRPESVIFEVTESLAVEDMNLMKKVLQKLREKGFQIALDDFGSGYSSLNHVMEMPLDYIKVDKEFIAGYGSTRFSPALLHAIAELAHRLSLKVIVEGVEKKSQVDFLGFLDVDQYQGFYFGKPVPKDAFYEQWIQQGVKENR